MNSDYKMQLAAKNRIYIITMGQGLWTVSEKAYNLTHFLDEDRNITQHPDKAVFVKLGMWNNGLIETKGPNVKIVPILNVYLSKSEAKKACDNQNTHLNKLSNIHEERLSCNPKIPYTPFINDKIL